MCGKYYGIPVVLLMFSRKISSANILCLPVMFLSDQLYIRDQFKMETYLQMITIVRSRMRLLLVQKQRYRS